MEDGERRSTLTPSPSFRERNEGDDGRAVPFFHQESPPQISAVNRSDGPGEDPPDGGDHDEPSDDFEFAFVLKDPEVGPSITADEIFSNGQIRPVYPVFGRSLLVADEAAESLPPKPPARVPLRRLLSEERNSSVVSASNSSSSMDELDGIPEDTYCVWTPGSVPPSPARCRKSRSTGSLMRWRKISDLVGRSHSDGKEKFVFFSAAEVERKERPNPTSDGKAVNTGKAKEAKEKEKVKEAKGGKVTEVDMVTAHRIYYGKGANQRGGARKSFLPYRQDIVGFFTNVNGLSRNYHPF
ncbi:uncharacterized protein [Typha angustifolia]|uniref:uncharacterized protein n=1 Tax=Typha angustifolia TaxID=59011 RepID=UPI003C2D8598